MRRLFVCLRNKFKLRNVKREDEYSEEHYVDLHKKNQSIIKCNASVNGKPDIEIDKVENKDTQKFNVPLTLVNENYDPAKV